MTSSSPPPLKRGLGCLPIALVVLGALIFALIAGGYTGTTYYSGSRADAKAREVDRLRQLGIPTNTAELDRFYFVDTKARELGVEMSNALSSFSATWEIYEDVHFIDRLADVGGRSSPENTAVLRDLLADNPTYLSEIHRLVNIPHDVRYPLDFSQGLLLEFPFAPDVRLAVRMFAADAQIAALDDDVARVVDDCIDAIKTAETLRDSPILILQLVRIACQGIALDRLEYAINAVAIPRESLQRLRETLQQLDLNGTTEYGMIGELCLVDSSLFHVLTEKQQKASKFLRKYHRFPDIWSANLFLTNSELMRIGELPPWERYQAAEEVTERLMDKWMLFHVFEQLLTPAIGRAYEAENRILGVVAATQTGLAILDYAGNKGALPEDLSTLVPDYIESIPLDPFDGQLVRYRRTETGFVVYSIAHNRIDDGGKPPPDDKKVTEAGDLVFRVLDASPYLQQKDAA